MFIFWVVIRVVKYSFCCGLLRFLLPASVRMKQELTTRKKLSPRVPRKGVGPFLDPHSPQTKGVEAPQDYPVMVLITQKIIKNKGKHSYDQVIGR